MPPLPDLIDRSLPDARPASVDHELVFDCEATRARIHYSGIGSTRDQYRAQSCDKLLH
jgi:hypothetical protein